MVEHFWKQKRPGFESQFGLYVLFGMQGLLVYIYLNFWDIKENKHFLAAYVHCEILILN